MSETNSSRGGRHSGGAQHHQALSGQCRARWRDLSRVPQPGECADRRKRRGEVHADADSGGRGERRMKASCLLDGKAIALQSPRDAAAHGISIVHQELLALTNLNISENIFAGRELCRRGDVRRSSRGRTRAPTRRCADLRKPMDVATETGEIVAGLQAGCGDCARSRSRVEDSDSR